MLESHAKDSPADKRTAESAPQMSGLFGTLVDSRPVKAVYALATLDSKTMRGGEVATSSREIRIGGKSIARMGDLVRYQNGTVSPIFSYAYVFDGKPIAIGGSHIEKGDVIEISIQKDVIITEYADGKPTRVRCNPTMIQTRGKNKHVYQSIHSSA